MATKTKLSLSMVCKSWHAVGIEFLYGDIVFRSVQQLPAFLRVIEVAPSKFQNLVKGLTINTFVAFRHGASFSRYLQRIIDNCPSLTRFEIVSPVTLPPALTYPSLDGVTELRITMTSPDLIHLLDTTHRALRSLFISIPYTLENIDAVQPYTLPNLENLVVNLEAEKPTPEASSKLGDALFDLLDVSCLLRFTFTFHGEKKRESDFCTTLVPFLGRKGQALLFLHLEGCSQEVVQQLLDRCPVLEHLRLHHMAEDTKPVKITHLSEPAKITHPSIKWLDHGPQSRPFQVQKAFPQLQGMRVIDSLDRGYVDCIHQEFIVTDNDAHRIDFPGISFLNEVGLIHVDVNTSLSNWIFRRVKGPDSDFTIRGRPSEESEDELSSNSGWESDESDSDASLGDLEIAGSHWQDQPLTDHNSDEEELVQ